MSLIVRLAPRVLRDEVGQAAAELIGTVPFVLLGGLVAWQLALAGQTLWLCANAARVAARAEAVGRDARAAARSALPSTLEKGLRITSSGAGAVRVQLRMPFLVRSWLTPLHVAASAGLPRGGL